MHPSGEFQRLVQSMQRFPEAVLWANTSPGFSFDLSPVYISVILPVCIYGSVFIVTHAMSLQTRGVLPYFANFRLLSELSTPFVNQR